MSKTVTGGCYCGSVRYEAGGEAAFKGQCYCRECQYIAGGGPNYVIAFPQEGFRYTAGEPKAFSRRDLPNPVTRQFCGECGTHLCTLTPGAPGLVLVKVGTLDDPSLYDKPDHCIWASDKQPYHQIPEEGLVYQGFPS